MKNWNQKKHILATLFLILAGAVFYAQDSPVPKLTGRVVDEAKIINGKTEDEIESYLKSVEENSGIQIAVLTVNSIPVSIEEYAVKVFETWKLGQAGKDNGVLVVVAVKDRKLRIEVGYGLEGVLTDTKCGIIIRNVITPHFKEGNYAEGIFNGVKTLAGYASGDEKTVKKVDSAEKDEGFPPLPLILWLIFVGFIVFMNTFGRRRFGRHGAGPIIFTGGNHHDGFGGFGGGGFGGGGFKGGGGSSGGGGASGGW